jgi:hypothetical protein
MLYGMRRTLRCAIVLILAGTFVLVARPADADPITVRHNCKNSTTVSENIVAGLCADVNVDLELRWVIPGVVGFCQINSGTRRIVACDGIVEGADLYRRPPQGGWTMIWHGTNDGCGSRFPSGGSCRAVRYSHWSESWGYGTDCYYYKAGARASFTYPSGWKIEGLRVESTEWASPACDA